MKPGQHTCDEFFLAVAHRNVLLVAHVGFWLLTVSRRPRISRLESKCGALVRPA